MTATRRQWSVVWTGIGGIEGILGTGIDLWASGGVWRKGGTAVVRGGGARMGWGLAVKD